MPISDEVKQAIRKRAGYVREYGCSPQRLRANRLTIKHIISRSLDSFDALAFAYLRCNKSRYNFVASIDPKTPEIVPNMFL